MGMISRMMKMITLFNHKSHHYYGQWYSSDISTYTSHAWAS